MTLDIFMLWFIIWIVFLIMSIIETRGVTFGFLSGLYPLFLGVYLFLDGIQVQSGMTISYTAGVQTVEKVYANSIPAFSSYGMLFGLPFILLGIYICYLAATKHKGV